MEILIGTQTYRTNRLSAFAQLHVARRLTPCLGKLAGIRGADLTIARDDSGQPVGVDGDLSGVLVPLGDALASLSDTDVEHIIEACLDAVERKQSGGGWAPVRKDGVTMFELPLPVMLQIVYEVMRESLSDFFTGLPPGSPLVGLIQKLQE